MIDVTKPDTFPKELADIVLTHIASISDNELQKIKNCKIVHETDVQCAIDRFLGVSAAYQMYQDKLIPIFNRYELICYHATRVGNIETLLEDGLCSCMDKYEKRLIEFLRIENVPEDQIRLAQELIRKEYLRKYRDNHHQICFFTNYISLHDEEGSCAYDQFCETVGGELANWALENDLPNVWRVLRTKGIPVVIKFKLPFSMVANYHKDSLIFPFVSAVAAKHLWGFDYIIESDSSLIGDVPPSNIINITEIKSDGKCHVQYP